MAAGTSSNVPVIGIDLGTTLSCVYVMKNGIAEAVPNELGQRVTPSYVAYNESERLVGTDAKNQIAMNPTNTIFDVKRLIGLEFDNPNIQANLDSYPFTIRKSDENKPLICVQSRGKTEKFLPEEISGVILEKLKTMAESYLGIPIKKAVITVPARFNNDQREATRIAGEIAGLDVLNILNEPTAAALAFGVLEEDKSAYKSVLVYDLGGGTFDVTILSMGGKMLKAKATEGDNHLGGEDFDNNLIEYCLIEIRKSIKDLSILKTDKRSMQRLRSACEQAKCSLLNSTEAQIFLSGLFEGKDFKKKITRAKFNSLNEQLFKKTLEIVTIALKQAKMDKNDIDNVLLVGGSTRIVRIRELLAEYFGSSKISNMVHADEVVALGALFKAMKLAKSKSGNITEWLLAEISSLPLGIKVEDDGMSVVIKQNTVIPCKVPKMYTTCEDNQTVVSIMVYEGSSKNASENHFLGEFMLTGIPPMPKEVPQIVVSFEYDTNGILDVKATDQTESHEHNDPDKAAKIRIHLKNSKIHRVPEMSKRMVEYRKLDIERKEACEAKNKLHEYCEEVKSKLSEVRLKDIPNISRDAILADCKKIESWLEEEDEIQDKLAYIKRKLEIENQFNEARKKSRTD